MTRDDREDKSADNARTDISQFFAMAFMMPGGYIDMADVYDIDGDSNTTEKWATAAGDATSGLKAYTLYNLTHTSDNYITDALNGNNSISAALASSSDRPTTWMQPQILKTSRTVNWNANWRMDAADRGEPGKAAVEAAGGNCSDDGFSWPHRTLGWKMLKDDLFGIDFQGNVVAAGGSRVDYLDIDGDGVTTLESYTAHDIDSVCLDCHNPTVWNATVTGLAGSGGDGDNHYDDPNDPNDNMDDDMILRGLP